MIEKITAKEARELGEESKKSRDDKSIEELVNRCYERITKFPHHFSANIPIYLSEIPYINKVKGILIEDGYKVSVYNVSDYNAGVNVYLQIYW